ncbi:MAG: hypothetical protein ACOWWO_17630 [Peptococcaceae bacterium]
MTEIIDVGEVRQEILKVVNKNAGSTSLQTSSILHEAIDNLGVIKSVEIEQIMLTIWYDLFRTGYLAWGFNIANPNPPFCHVTNQGREFLKNMSRDPFNSEGYLSYLAEITSLNPTLASYVNEALRTFNSDCYKASAVMIGVASESMLLDLRDLLVSRIRELDRKPQSDLLAQTIKIIIKGIRNELEGRKMQMDVSLKDQFEQFWPAYVGQIRTLRNDAGHPISIEPVTQVSVHAALLIFPELVKLNIKLGEWINTNYS